MPTILKASDVAEDVYARVSRGAKFVREKTNHAPTLATVLVGEDPGSQIYVKRKGEMCTKLGLGHKDFKFKSDITQAALLKTIHELNTDPEIDGILVQQPLPKHLSASEIFDAINPSKDVDCFSPHNVGLLVQGR